MNSIAAIFLAINSVALFALPRRWAPIPLVLGTCYMTLGPGFDVGPFTFTVVRVLVAVGLLRAVVRREGIAGGMNGLDWLMIAWAIWALISSRFHDPPKEALIYRMGLIYNACGIYFLLRTFCQSIEDAVRLCRAVAVLLLPVAIAMLYEKEAFFNLFSALGGVPETPMVRNDKIRCFGPFAHPILAGTVGAVCIPLAAALWRLHRLEALVGITACIAIVYASDSSGPVMSALAAVGALAMWPLRHRMAIIRWLAVLGYIALDLVMKVPAYYLIGRIDITGGSTGYHRAALIESAINHLGEWWLGGTDYTRHWMPTGQSWNANHTDITNEYLSMGVVGGLPLMLLFIATLAKAFSLAGQALEHTPDRLQFIPWALGAALFAHVATSISVSYFDQSFMFIYLTLAAIGSARPQLALNRTVREPVTPALRRRREGHGTQPSESPAEASPDRW